MTAARVMPPDGWTDRDFDALPEDGLRRELIDGVLHVSPSPAGRHQLVSFRLTAAVDAGKPSAHVVLQEMEIKLTDAVRFIPDVLVVSKDAYGDGRPHRYQAHDVVLAVEVVSESSRAIDRFLKPPQYAAAGIPLYWRVEFEPTLTIHTFRRSAEGTYESTGSFDRELRTEQPWPLTVDVVRLSA